MKTSVLALILVSSFGAPASAKDIVEEQLAPSTRWYAQQAENGCRLGRAFGGADKPLLLRFERFGLGDGFQLTLIGEQLRGWRPPTKLTVRYGEGGRSHELDEYLAGTASDGTPMIRFGSSLASDQSGSPVTPDVEAGITTIALLYQDKHIALKTGSLGAVFAQLRRCTDDLLKTWGVDAEKLRQASRRARPSESPAWWATTNDYEAFSGAKGKRAVVNFRLVIGIDGKVANCLVLSSYPIAVFDELTCKLISQRARFQPAARRRRQADRRPVLQ